MKGFSVFLVVLLTLLICIPSFAQQDRGTFTGTVTDPTGSVVPNVAVTVQNMETNVTYTSRTNAVGSYTIPNLPIGRYRITFEATGFKKYVRDGVTLNIAQVVRIDAPLEVGATAETVEVTAEAPLLQTETPEVGTSLSTQQVIDLPLGFSGGRYAEDFAYKLTPGVGGNNWESHINGAPSFSKEVVLDGASASIYISGQFGESSPSMEALEEFKIQTSGMSAEFARTAGGVFNFVMKSGTNDFHGSGMFQWHNESFDANTFANNFYGRERRRDRRDNWAVSAGGPVYIPKVFDGRNRWFWYSAYEKYNESFAGGGSPTVTVPQTEWYDGNMSSYLTNEVIGKDALGRDVLRGAIYDPATTRFVDGQMVRDMFPGNIIPAARISQVSRNLAAIMKKHYMPEVKQADGSYALINNSFFPVSNQAGFNQTQFSTKSDFVITDAHRISGSFVWVDRPRTLLDQGGVWDFNDPDGGPLSRARLQYVASHYVRLAEDWTISPTMLNHMVLAYNRQINPSTSKHVDEPGGQILGIKGIKQDSNFPEIDGLSGDRVGFPLLGYQANDILAGTAWQFINTFSWMKGKHSIRFGFDYRWNGLNARNDAGPGRFNFSSGVTGLPGFNQTGHGFASMLLGQVSSASGPADVPVGSQFPMYSWFVQDDWKVSPRLTLNLGLRWDYQPQGTEKYDRLSNFNPFIMDPVLNVLGAVEYAGKGEGRNGKRMFYPNQRNDFGPRIGFAWQATARTTLRGGYGIFYSPRVPNGWSGVPWGQKMGFAPTNTVNEPAPNTAAFSWDDGYPGVVKPATLDPSAASYLWGPVSWDPDGGRVGYTQQWNFNIQRELPGQMVLDIGYIGSKSTGLQANELRRPHQMPYSSLALKDTLGQWIDSQSAIPAAAVALGARYASLPGTWVPVSQTLQPFPQIPNWSAIYSWNSPLGFSTYQALAIQLNKRMSHGLQFLSNYTFSKNIGNISSAFGDTWGQNWGRPMDYFNLALEKSVLEFDRTHVVKIGGSYELPFGRGRRFGTNWSRPLSFVAGGWQIMYIGNYSSGAPMNLGATGTPNFNAATNRPFIVNPDGKPIRNPNFRASDFDMTDISTARPNKTYIDTSLVIDPVKIDRYARGNAPRLVSQLRGTPSYFEDISLLKNFVPTEGVRVQFRAEFLNVLNRHRISDFTTGAASPLFGQVSGVSDDRRVIQFGLRADF
ncbi:MAG: TonB-dependent receptor domain-containing protein [Rhodospirillales bacterium]